MDYIFDLMRKTSKVISSCKNVMQIESAYNYVDNLEKYLSHFEKTKRQTQFKKMLKIKNRSFNEFVD